MHVDATLACGGNLYGVHKLVLSACSNYFSDILRQTNFPNPTLILQDIRCEDLEALLDYMYLGWVDVKQSNLATLVKAAECLKLKGLAIPDEEVKKSVADKVGIGFENPSAKRRKRTETSRLEDSSKRIMKEERIDNCTTSPLNFSADIKTEFSSKCSDNKSLKKSTNNQCLSKSYSETNYSVTGAQNFSKSSVRDASFTINNNVIRESSGSLGRQPVNDTELNLNGEKTASHNNSEVSIKEEGEDVIMDEDECRKNYVLPEFDKSLAEAAAGSKENFYSVEVS